jgi:hypothetical protein
MKILASYVFRKLSPKQIDEVWYRCGFIIKGHKKGYKALRKSDMDGIVGEFDTAKEKIWRLIAETRISGVKEALSETEKAAPAGKAQPAIFAFLALGTSG